ncbi:hypothetical protein HNP55_003583 [Paucibacter oligotrophus]|uniref:Uncharacterized protein n=1 Tax=Roseateles oligotrophus TaxID=1769250 RepID=A0A840LIE3_9BURK|nr:hypothetical protein [Roseateles oligotrophus]MBB4845037.1 hypothetical protein [Roseateles oligotrophus]
MSNLFAAFRRLLPNPALQVGKVIAIVDGVATLELPGGGRVQARGTGTVGGSVFFRDGVIEGDAPTLTDVDITV